MNLDRYQQWLLAECNKIAHNPKDRRPGEPFANVPIAAQESVYEMINAGLLKTVKASPSGRRTLTYLVVVAS